MTVTDAPTPIGAGAHRGTSLTMGGGSSSESASISWVLRSINGAEGPRVLPRTLALINLRQAAHARSMLDALLP